jgi:catechol 2,3-dioxygenase-like lactoylglutathione lyase family enzyme
VGRPGAHPICLLPTTATASNVVSMDMKLELVGVPVTDVDEALDFYRKAGFALDHDHTVSDDVGFVDSSDPDGNGWSLQRFRTGRPAPAAAT